MPAASARPIVMTTIAMAAGMVPSRWHSTSAVFLLMECLSSTLIKFVGRFVGRSDEPDVSRQKVSKDIHA